MFPTFHPEKGTRRNSPTYRATKETPCDQHRFQDICGAADLRSANCWQVVGVSKLKNLYDKFTTCSHNYHEIMSNSSNFGLNHLSSSRRNDSKHFKTHLFLCNSWCGYLEHLRIPKAVVVFQTIRSFPIPCAKTLKTDQASIYGQWLQFWIMHYFSRDIVNLSHFLISGEKSQFKVMLHIDLQYHQHVYQHPLVRFFVP